MERLIKVGKIKPKKSSEVTNSRLGLGFEKLDRDVFDPKKAYDKAADTGVKWIRLQSGWARTEQTKGVYNFGWLDDIVDNLIARSLKPWICLCYGNELYNAEAKEVFGAVGCVPIFTLEQKDAWDNYVAALAAHFRGRIEYYEIWNEPDCIHSWKHGVNAKEYAEFAIRTAKAVKSADKDAKIIGGALGGDFSCRNMTYINTVLKCGLAEYIDALTFHEYTHDENTLLERADSLRALLDVYNKDIKLIQGEAGSQSRSGGHGALYEGAWTEDKQAKHLLRLNIAALSTGVEFSSYFSCLDMIEALNGNVNDKASYLDYGYFGVLKADFDENGCSTGEYSPKKSFYALCNIASVFSEDYTPFAAPVVFIPEASPRIYDNDLKRRDVMTFGFKRNDNSYLFAYWKSTNIMTSDFEGTVTLQCFTGGQKIHLVDFMDSNIYEIPDTIKTEDGEGCVLLKNLPVKDYPMALVIGDFIK